MNKREQEALQELHDRWHQKGILISKAANLSETLHEKSLLVSMGNAAHYYAEELNNALESIRLPKES